MPSLWPNEFPENPSVSARALLEEQVQFLKALTQDAVSAEVVEENTVVARSLGINNEFCFMFNLIGRYINNYKFKLFSYSHDISLYPVTLAVDESIANELQLEGGERYYVAEDERALLEFVEKIFKSKKAIEVIGSIIKLSR